MNNSVKSKVGTPMRKWLRSSVESKSIDIVVYLFCTFVLFATLYPFYYILIISFNEGLDAQLGGIYWLPRAFTLENFEQFFTDERWLVGLRNSVLRTIIGTTIGVLFTSIVAYGLSFKNLVGRKFYLLFFIFSMYFSGGIIPYFALLRGMGLLNTFAVYVIPGAVSVFFLLIGLSFFSSIPASLRESAKIDGASELTVFARIIMPISKPFIATCVLFTGVGHWNNWFDTAFFVRDRALATLSYLMMQVINSVQIAATAAQVGVTGRTSTTLSIQSAAMVVATIPIICVYPFLQKYFVSGMMIGAVKE